MDFSIPNLRVMNKKKEFRLERERSRKMRNMTTENWLSNYVTGLRRHFLPWDITDFSTFWCCCFCFRVIWWKKHVLIQIKGIFLVIFVIKYLATFFLNSILPPPLPHLNLYFFYFFFFHFRRKRDFLFIFDRESIQI